MWLTCKLVILASIYMNTIMLCIMYVYRSRDWTGDFTTSFQDLLPGGVFHVPSDEDKSNKVCISFTIIIIKILCHYNIIAGL